MLYYFKKGKNATEMCVEKVLWLIKCVKSGLRSFALEISLWMMLPPQAGRPAEVDSEQIKTLIENNQCYTTQEIADILKISINKVIGENENNVSFISWKKLNWLFGQPRNN